MNILGWSFFRDACIINLSHNYESSFKSPFYLFLTTDLIFIYLFFTNKIPFFLTFKNISNFSFTNLKSIIFSFTRTDLILSSKIFFFFKLIFLFTKTDLMSTNQILFSKLNTKQIRFFLIKSFFLFLTFHKNRFDFFFFYKPSLMFLIFKIDLNIFFKRGHHS